MNLTIVIPTHNRGAKLAATVERLLANDPAGLDEIQVIVVDDGSAVPAGPVVDGLRVPPPFELRCVRLCPNLGPAGARNAGFRAARGELVLFVDDDILAPPDLIARHVEAHRLHPQSVICGSWRLLAPEPITPLFRYVETLGHETSAGLDATYVRVSIVSSGHISVRRDMFPAALGVYRDNLAVPAAEEYELSLRLRDRGVPVLVDRRNVAWHDHPVTLQSMCRQAFKHAMGCAEAAVKCPGTLDLENVQAIVAANRPDLAGSRTSRTCKTWVKSVLSRDRTRAGLLWTAERIERAAPRARVLPRLYRTVMGLNVYAGFREGLRRYDTRLSGAIDR